MTGDPTNEFLDWLRTRHREAGIALHNGDESLKLDTWSTRDPVTLFGAFWFEADSAEQARAALVRLARKFSNCTDYSYDLVAYGVSGDLAYTVGYEHAVMEVDGRGTAHRLRVTQVYRLEDGTWKVVHRHADPADDARAGTH